MPNPYLPDYQREQLPRMFVPQPSKGSLGLTVHTLVQESMFDRQEETHEASIKISRLSAWPLDCSWGNHDYRCQEYQVEIDQVGWSHLHTLMPDGEGGWIAKVNGPPAESSRVTPEEFEAALVAFAVGVRKHMRQYLDPEPLVAKNGFIWSPEKKTLIMPSEEETEWKISLGFSIGFALPDARAGYRAKPFAGRGTVAVFKKGIPTTRRDILNAWTKKFDEALTPTRREIEAAWKIAVKRGYVSN